MVRVTAWVRLLKYWASMRSPDVGSGLGGHDVPVEDFEQAEEG